MRGGGFKGFPRTRVFKRKHVERVEHAVTSTKGVGGIRYITTGQITTDAGNDYTPTWVQVWGIFNGIYQDSYAAVIDLGVPGTLAWVSFSVYDVEWSGSLVYQRIDLGYSHDNVRWYTHSGKHYLWQHLFSTGESWGRVLITQPVPKARYWRILKQSSPVYSALEIWDFSVGTIKERDPAVLVDTEYPRKEKLNISGVFYEHHPNQIHIGKTLNFGWSPEYLMFSCAQSEVGDECYPTTLEYMKYIRKESDWYNKSKITQLLTHGVCISEMQRSLSSYDTFHPNAAYFISSSLNDVAMYVSAFRSLVSDGVYVSKNFKVGSNKTLHNLAEVPDLVFMYDSTDGYTLLHKSAPNDVIYFSGSKVPTARSTAKIQVSAARIDHNLTVAGDTFHALCLMAQTGSRAFGTYTGNGLVAGPSVSGLGFKPSFVAVFKYKAAEASKASIAFTLGAAATTFIGPRAFLDSGATTTSMDVDATGFTVTSAHADINESGVTYLYWAMDPEA